MQGLTPPAIDCRPFGAGLFQARIGSSICPVGSTLLTRVLASVVAVCAYLLLHANVPDPGTNEQLAYIGPGPGLALMGSAFAILIALLSAIGTIVSYPFFLLVRAIRGRKRYAKAKVKRVVVLGLDGLEPTVTEKLLEEGRLPNLAKLQEQGCYRRLGSTWPPISPVSWSSFTTGTNPGKHNIFDFIARTPNYRPMISSVRMGQPRRKLKLGNYVIPLSKPELTPLRKSKPFWTVLGEHGLNSMILRVPITFPPDRFKGLQLSAMSVPDLRGTQGMFSYYAEEGETGATMDGDVGGDRILVHRNGKCVQSFLRGPANSLRADGAELRLPFKVTESRNGAAGATLHVNGRQVPLKLNQHSDWVKIEFRAAPGVKVRGICKFYLKRFAKPFEMYCTPLQIDPDKPVMPISHPVVFSSYLARQQGSYSTLGLAEDTWSLSEKLMSEDAFLEQAYQIHEERETMFFDALERVRRGTVVCVFDGPDRIQHMFFRFHDEQHPALTNEQRESHRHAMTEMYERMDDLVGRTMTKLDDDTVLFVMSDHGFKTFRRGVDLNAWLRDNGYLKLKDGKQVADKQYLGDIDWSQTRAFALGLAGIYLNQKGRETQGIVEPGKPAKALMREIADKLTGVVDEEKGAVAIKEAVTRLDVFHGPYTENAPDILVGYNEGWRVSWDAAIGKCAEQIFSDNLKAWSGDHCLHPALVPGILFSSLKLSDDEANIIDLAPTTLELFGVERPKYMDGKSLLCPENVA
ncbi:MAG: alkaline phosphatase family protein [Planctomycetes bacterium]|nr:alkaline phosphatase family protein [Planctomycetota bacterium]